MTVFWSSNPLDWYAADGTYVSEETVRQAAAIAGTNVVQVVGVFPWGSEDTLLRISDAQELKDQLFGQASNPEAYAAARALMNKPFGILEVVRVAATGAAKSSRTIDANGYTVTAKHNGVVGDEIETLHTDTGAGTFSLRVQWNQYVKTYSGLTLATIGSVSDPYVDLALSGTGTIVAATDGAAVALSGGSDGTAVDADYTGGVSSVRGLRVLEEGTEEAICFVAGYTSAAVISALKTFITDMRAFCVVQADSDRADFAANLAVAVADSTSQLIYCLHGVRDTFNGVEYGSEDLTAYVASALSYNPPHYPISEKEEIPRVVLGRILGPTAGVSLGRANRVSAAAAGGIMLESMDTGFSFANALQSDGVRIAARRPIVIATRTIVNAMATGQNKPDMPYFERTTIGGAKDAIDVLKGDPDTNPRGAIIEDARITREPDTVPNAVNYTLAIKAWEGRRFQIIRLIAGDSIEIDEIIPAA